MRGFVEQTRGKYATSKGAHVFFQLYVCVCLCVVYITLILLILVRECVAISRRARIANLVGEDSCCREGIVNIRVDFSRERLVWPQSSKALWRFRASTSNSPSGRSRLPTYTHKKVRLRHIHQIYVQQDIRVYEDDHFQPPKRQYPNPKALSPLRVSI